MFVRVEMICMDVAQRFIISCNQDTRSSRLRWFQECVLLALREERLQHAAEFFCLLTSKLEQAWQMPTYNDPWRDPSI